MHAYTLIGATQFVYRHRIVERKDSPGAKSPMDLPLVRTSTGILAFSHELTDKQSRLLETLQNAHEPKSRNWLAKTCHRGRDTIQQDIDALVSLERIAIHPLKRNGRVVYLYEIPNPNPIRRSPYYWWKRCPSCDADRKLRRMASGNYEHWCRCGHFQVISKEMMK